MPLIRRSVWSVIATLAVWVLFVLPLSAQATETVSFDFVSDREFPAEAKKKREFSDNFTFEKQGIMVIVTALDQQDKAVDVSRRGPGGLGVKGNGDRDKNGNGTTSGNRVNNGEKLLIAFKTAEGEPMSVTLVEIVLDRIVHDRENFPDSPPTAFELHVNGQAISGSELAAGEQTVTINLGQDAGAPSADTFALTNGKPFHPIANRFRLASIKIAVDN